MARITLAVTGSIASYKAADLVSGLKKQGHSVTVLMTQAATAFIQPLTLQVLSQNTVHLDLMQEPSPDKVNHIELGKETDLFILALRPLIRLRKSRTVLPTIWLLLLLLPCQTMFQN